MALAELRERNRALPQAFEGEIVKLAALGEQERRLEAVACEPGAAADADGLNRRADREPPGRTDPSKMPGLP